MTVRQATAAKERPILFTGPMVRAIQAGLKTQTRRIHDKPRYAVGDHMWMKETWRPFSWTGDGAPFTIQYRADMATKVEAGPDTDQYEDWAMRIWEAVSDECEKAGCEIDDEGNFKWDLDKGAPTKWRPSIFMPRWCSRITREVTSVRRERVQDISEGDAKAEGIRPDQPLIGPVRYRAGFKDLWNSLNAKRGHGWDANDYVWVYEFRRVTLNSQKEESKKC